MKHILRSGLVMLLGMTMLTTATTARAQSKWGRDSAKAVVEYSLYLEFVKQKDYPMAYQHWQWLFENAPRINEGLYIRGIKILKALIKSEKDPARKERLIDSLMRVHDQRIRYFDKRAENTAKKAIDWLKYRPKAYDSTYVWLKEALQAKPNLYAAPYYYIVTAVKRTKAGKGTKEELLADYQLATTVVDHYLASDTKKKEKWQSSLDKINKLMAPYLDCDAIVQSFGKPLQEKRADTVFVKKLIRLLEAKKCQQPLYATALEAYLKQRPDAKILRKLSQYYLRKKQPDRALEVFKRYGSQLSSPADRATVELSMANVYLQKGQYATAKTHAMKAIRLKPDYGLAYIVLGDIYVAGRSACAGNDFEKQAVYWVAVDKYILAKQKDPSVAAQANKRIATYSKHFPTKEEIFFQLGASGIGQSYTVKCWINETTTVRPGTP